MQANGPSQENMQKFTQKNKTKLLKRVCAAVVHGYVRTFEQFGFSFFCVNFCFFLGLCQVCLCYG